METIKPYYELSELGIVYRLFPKIFGKRPPERFIDFGLSFLLFKRVVLNIGNFDDWATEQYGRKHPDHTGNISLKEMTRDLGGDDGVAFIKALINLGENKHQHKYIQLNLFD